MYYNIIKFIRTNYAVIITLSIFTLLQLPVLDTSRPIMVDEAWYSNPAYNFIISNSFSNTNIGFGGNGLMPFSIYLSSYFYIFGISLFAVRLSSFILGLITLLIFRKILKILDVKEFYCFITLSFFIFSNFILSVFKHARPEALTFTLSLCLLLTLFYYLKKNFSIKLLLLLILLSFLAINSHPYGSIIVLLSFLIISYFIIIKSEYSKIFHLVFYAIGAVFSLFFIVWMSSLCNSISLSESLSIILQRNTADTTFWRNLILKFVVTSEYFITSNRIITFIPQMLLIITGLFFLKKNKSLFALSLCGIISLIIPFLFFSPSGFIYIYSYVFIFPVLILAVLLQTMETNELYKKVIVILTAIVVLLNIVAYVALTKKTFDPGINKKMKEISSLLPDGSLVISEPPFWFVSPQKNIKTAKYLKSKNILLNDKDFYVINCDKFKSEFVADSNSLAFMNTYNELHKVDTLLIKQSNLYGNICLIKHSVNSFK